MPNSLQHRQSPAPTINFSPTRKLSIDDAAYWLDRAEEVQLFAEGMTNSEPRAQMMRVAETYRRLAELAYERAKNE